MNKSVCWIAGAGEFYAPAFAPLPGDYVIAADGGYESLRRHGATIDMALGDFDSLGYVPKHRNVVRCSPVKDDTDMALAVKEGLSLGYERFALLGGLGGRLGHTLANLQTLLYLSRRGARGFLIGKNETATALTDGELYFSDAHRGYLSLFCLSEPACGVTLRGLKYELTDATLESFVALGVSNEFTGRESSVAVARGTLVVLWQDGRLEEMLRA